MTSPVLTHSTISTRSTAEAAARSGELGDIIAYVRVLRGGDGAPADPARAEAWLRFALAKAVVFGDDTLTGAIQVQLADLVDARGDREEARELLEQAADGGEAAALDRLAGFLSEDDLDREVARTLRGRARQLQMRLN